MDGLQQVHEERYAACLTAITECIVKGASQKTVEQLAFECGIDKRDMDKLWNFKQQEAA